MAKIMEAAGHVYHPSLGNGVEWMPEIARLWQDGAAIAEAPHNTASAYEFFHELKFAEAFAEVDYWWFRSTWQGDVMLSRPRGLIDNGGGIYGYMQFNNDETPGQMWTMTDDAPALLGLPFPPGEWQFANLPLLLNLARLVLAIIDDQDEVIVPDEWLTISGRVRRDDSVDACVSEYCLPLQTLAEAFPTRFAALTHELPIRLTALVSDNDPLGVRIQSRRYAFEDVPDLTMRDLLCVLQGLIPPEAVGQGEPT